MNSLIGVPINMPNGPGTRVWLAAGVTDMP
jgi:hypothetical protein